MSTFANSRNKQLDYEICLRKTFSRSSGEARAVSRELNGRTDASPLFIAGFQGFRESLSFQAEMSELEERGRFCLDQSGIFYENVNVPMTKRNQKSYGTGLRYI